MADPFSALTISCAALQFLDTGAKFISKTYKIYKSADGAPQEITDLEWAAEKLKAAVKVDGVQQYRSSQASASEKAMIVLCDECQKFAEDLLSDIEPLRPKGQTGVWRSAKVAFRVDRRQIELRASQKRLAQLKLEINAQLLRVLGDKQATTIHALDQLQRRDIASNASVDSGLQQLRTDLISELQTQRRHQASVADISRLLQHFLDDARTTSAKLHLLDSLRYEGMETRRDVISETHADTYAWVFSLDDQRCRTAHLRDWLQSGEGLFWVSGKPGSGKSTFMKFVGENRRTRELLEGWARQKNSTLVTAAHYFTVNGDETQKSEAGLLRSILADLVQGCPDVFNDVWKPNESAHGDFWPHGSRKHDWSTSTLRKMLQTVQHTPLMHQGRQLCYVLFIDGLDEYAGDHKALTQTLKQLTLTGHIKICVSSRPWNVFERAFGDNEDTKLYMHDLTQEDIRTFVQDRIGNELHFQQLLREDHTAQDLLDSIISRAEGVFLWVYLVERQVNRSLENQDGLAVLKRRVDQFPSDLDDYFRYMFDNLDPFYRKDTARIFLMCLGWPEIPVIGFAILDVEARAAKETFTAEAQFTQLKGRLRAQILAKGQDLIQVSEDHFDGTCANFMHRTATDFLKQDEMHAIIRRWAGEDFDVDQHVFEAFAVHCHALSHSSKQDSPSLFERSLSTAFNLASWIERTQHRNPYNSLDDLWRLTQANSALHDKVSAMNRFDGGEPLLRLALEEGLTLFLDKKAAAGEVDLRPSESGASLLYFAIDGYKGTDVDFITMLLDLGHSPNDMHQEREDLSGMSVWKNFLCHLQIMAQEKLGIEGYMGLCETLITAGAEEAHQDWNERDILEYAFGSHEADRLQALRHSTAGAGDLEHQEEVSVSEPALPATQAGRGVFQKLRSLVWR